MLRAATSSTSPLRTCPTFPAAAARLRGCTPTTFVAGARPRPSSKPPARQKRRRAGPWRSAPTPARRKARAPSRSRAAATQPWGRRAPRTHSAAGRRPSAAQVWAGARLGCVEEGRAWEGDGVTRPPRNRSDADLREGRPAADHRACGLEVERERRAHEATTGTGGSHRHISPSPLYLRVRTCHVP